MNNIKKIFLLCSFFFGFSAHAKSQIQYEKIKVTGNVRTSTEYILYNTQKCLDEAEEKDSKILLLKLKQCLYNTRLFSRVAVDNNSDEVLDIHVEERWTFIPIPFGNSGSDGQSTVGLIILESNLFGLGKSLGLGGTYSSNGSSYFGFYRDNQFLYTPWRFGLSANASQQNIYLYRQENSIDGFWENKTLENIQFGYELTKNLTVDSLFQSSQIKTKTLDKYNMNPDDVDSNSVGLQFNFKNSDYRLYYQDGFEASGKTYTQISRTDNSALTTQETLKIQYSTGAFENQSVLFLLQAGKISGGNIVDLFKLGNNPGFRGIQKLGAWADSYLSLDTEYLIPIHFFNSGVWATSIFGEAGILRAYSYGSKEKLNYESYGIGTYYFLKRIAIPGMGLEIGHNTHFQAFFVAASFGLNMN